MELKKPYSLDEQIQKLQNHGVIVEDVATTKMYSSRLAKQNIQGCYGMYKRVLFK
ncbi:MAG: hypothetical protein IJR96_09420 [Pseudobutyrivibrio sp.]|nr:hypothetical protein [Pseudobutyrivibrio sp.]